MLLGRHGLAHQGTEQRVDGCVGQRGHLIVAAILDRMRDEDAALRYAERARLNRRGFDKFDRGNKDAGEAAVFEIDDVVHTARRAAASIGESLDDRAALGGDLLPDADWRRLGEGRLAIPSHGCAALAEQHLDAIEEAIAARLGDVE